MHIDAGLPLDEGRRLATLQRYGVLDTEPEVAFDLLTRFLAAELNAPISLVSLVDSDRQWFKSRVGLDATQTDRTIAFCAHAIFNDEVMVVEDATTDVRFRQNPLVTGGPKIRSYAGAPLITPNGSRIGTLCAIHQEVTVLTPQDRDLLKMLSKWAVDLLEYKSLYAPSEQSQQRLASSSV